MCNCAKCNCACAFGKCRRETFSNSESVVTLKVCKTPTTKRTLDVNDSAPNTPKRAKEDVSDTNSKKKRKFRSEWLKEYEF
ncbi:hypothetical protein DPMN_109127 [Dreissena polymorpha]|uniref:Uncharacterized protein n=1 Tax=Dreissena polymorpha TaxID=45954 RepID=A0A9D4KAI8_DREPO|nr:hypothetical protein DPMN_109127 [Dreissena polymorpha]